MIDSKLKLSLIKETRQVNKETGLMTSFNFVTFR